MSVKPLKAGQYFIKEGGKPTPRKMDKHREVIKSNNVNVEDLLNVLMNKIDNLGKFNYSESIYEDEVNGGVGVVDVDFKNDIYINKVDISKISSEETKGKVSTKVDKLRKLRNMRNGS